MRNCFTIIAPLVIRIRIYTLIEIWTKAKTCTQHCGRLDPIEEGGNWRDEWTAWTSANVVDAFPKRRLMRIPMAVLEFICECV